MKSKLGLASILISFVSIILTIKTNLLIADTYINSDGKTKALFGILELSSFSYKYYYLILSILAFIFAWLFSKTSENKIMKITCFSFSLFSGILVFIRIWTWII